MYRADVALPAAEHPRTSHQTYPSLAPYQLQLIFYAGIHYEKAEDIRECHKGSQSSTCPGCSQGTRIKAVSSLSAMRKL